MSKVKKPAPWRLDESIIERVKDAATKLRRSQVDQVEMILEEWLNKFENSQQAGDSMN
jgi:hypothetical protein